MPSDTSLGLLQTLDTYEDEGHGHNYLTLQELCEKYAELTLETGNEARELQSTLSELIYTMITKEPAVSVEDKRIVFWFTDYKV
jgi:hypothetical protein